MPEPALARPRALRDCLEPPSPSTGSPLSNAPPSGSLRLRNAVILSLGFIVAIAIFLYVGGFRGYDRSPELVVGTLAGTLVIVAVVGYLGYLRRRALAGWRLALLIVGAPLALLCWKVGFSALFEGGDRWWPSKVGLKCMGVSIIDGCAILAALIATRRASIPRHPAAQGAAMGIAAGGLAWVLVDLWCPVAHPQHVLLGHVLPMLFLAAIGAWPGGTVLGGRGGGT